MFLCNWGRPIGVETSCQFGLVYHMLLDTQEFTPLPRQAAPYSTAYELLIPQQMLTVLGKWAHKEGNGRQQSPKFLVAFVRMWNCSNAGLVADVVDLYGRNVLLLTCLFPLPLPPLVLPLSSLPPLSPLLSLPPLLSSLPPPPLLREQLNTTFRQVLLL